MSAPMTSAVHIHLVSVVAVVALAGGCSSPVVATTDGEVGSGTGSEASDDSAGSTSIATTGTGSSGSGASSSSEGTTGSGAQPPSLCLETRELEGVVEGAPFALRDFDGDGRSELWRTEQDEGTFEVSVFAYVGDGQTETRAVWELPGRVGAVADVDHDGRPDVVFGDPDVQLYARAIMNDALDLDPTTIELPQLPGSPMFWDDVDGDGRVDVFVHDFEPVLSLQLAEVGGTYVSGPEYSVDPLAWPSEVRRSGPSQFTVAAENGALGFGLAYGHFTFEVDDAGQMTTIGIVPAREVSLLDARDRTGDGRPDLLLTDFTTTEVVLAVSGPSQEYDFVLLSEASRATVAGAFVESGRDEVLHQRHGLEVELWSGGATPTDAVEPIIGTEDLRSVRAVGDLDGDGLDEILVDAPFRVVEVVTCPE